MGKMAPNARFLDASQQTVVWFWKRLQNDELELQPPFQRNPVWQRHQKASLIDTIIRGYPVPELYLQTDVSAAGDEKHIVVDGQQRIRACMEYIAGEYALLDDSDEYSGYFFEDLPEYVRENIYRYKFVVRALPSLTDAEVRDIFGRLNRNNVVLNRQELRHATYWGEFIQAMTELSQNSFWVESGLFTANDFRRMLDIEYVSELAIATLYGVQNKKMRLDYYYGVFESEFPDRVVVERKFETTITQLKSILEWPNKTRWSKKVDFYTLFSTFAAKTEEMPYTKEEASRLAKRLGELAVEVSEVLSLGTDDDSLVSRHPAAVTYARGVRNSSDLGSRRLRERGLRAYLWDEPLIRQGDSDSGPSDEHLAKLPRYEDLIDAFEDEDPDEDGA